jgi:SAM-dependent methyltransferase
MITEERTMTAQEAIDANPVWYHTIELAPGTVTPGYVDMRKAAAKMLPDDLTGKRVLDIGTFDGFWAFEMERRGAVVTAIDLEKIDDAQWPPHKRDELKREVDDYGVELGHGFRLASQVLGSNVNRVISNVYDVTPERIGGQVDLAFIGTLVLHLRDPVRALDQVRACLSPGAELRLIEPISIALSLRAPRRPSAEFQTLTTPFNWWVPNLAGIDAWLRTARYERVRRLGFFRPGARPEMRQSYVGLAYAADA